MTPADFFAAWAGIETADAQPAADIWADYIRQRCNGVRLRRAGKSRSARGTRAFDDARMAAVDALGEIVNAGLAAREMTLIRPVAVVKPEMLTDLAAWTVVTAALRPIGVGCWPDSSTPKTTPLSVCDGCTMVFRPARKRCARYCRLCERRQPPLPLGMSGDLQQPGDTVRIAAPMLSGSGGITGWGTTTAGLCLECGDPFTGQSGKVFCSPRCEQLHRRR